MFEIINNFASVYHTKTIIRDSPGRRNRLTLVSAKYRLDNNRIYNNTITPKSTRFQKKLKKKPRDKSVFLVIVQYINCKKCFFLCKIFY